MTVQTNTNVASFLGNGAATYPIGFKFNSAADLVVQKTVIATGVTVTLTLNSDYSVAGAGIEEGGSITFSQAPTSAESVKVTRVVDLLQLTDLRNQGKFYAEVHEDVFDLLVMIDQQQQTEIDDANAKSDEAVATAISANAKSDQAVAKAAQNLVDMQAQYDAFEQGASLVVIGDYAAGLVVDGYNKVFRKDGEFYRAKAELALPYPLNGDWAVDAPKFVSVGDAVLRQELAEPDGFKLVGGTQPTVMTIAALAALGAGVSSVTVLHRSSIADLGGGQFAWVAGDQSSYVAADPLRGVWVAPSSDTTGTSGAYKRVYSALDFRYFGAKDDGSDAAGTTAAIQATYNYLKHIGGGAVRDDKGGRFALSATIRISGSGISSIFAGKNVTRFTRTDGTYGNTFHIAPDDPVNTRLQHIIFGRCSIEQLSTAMTSGAHLFVESLIHSTIFQQHWWNGFKSFTFKGLQQCVVHDTRIDTGSFSLSGVVAGSKFVECLAPDSVHENGEVFFSDFNWTFTGNAVTEIGIDIRAADGLWFSNGHVFGAQTECRIAPQTTTVQLEGVHFNQVWFDGMCTTNLSILSNSTGGFGEFTFTGCKFTGATGVAISITTGAVDLQNVEFTGGFIGNCRLGYMSLLQGDAITISGMQMMDGNRDALATTGIVVGTGVREFNMTGGALGTHVGSHAFSVGIDLQGADANANIHGVQFKNVTNEIKQAGHMALGSNLGGNSTARTAYNTITAAATIAIPGVCETVELSGGTTVEQINYGWDGRTILIRAVGGTQTLAHNTGAGSGKIYTNAGTSLSLAAGKCVRLTYSAFAGGWLQSA